MKNLLAKLGEYLIEYFGTTRGATYTIRIGRLLKRPETSDKKRKARAINAFLSAPGLPFKPMLPPGVIFNEVLKEAIKKAKQRPSIKDCSTFMERADAHYKRIDAKLAFARKHNLTR